MENNDPLINNAFMFIYVRQDKPCEEKIENLETVLNNGADINYRDANDKSNTILHIAAQRDEKDVVDYLIKKGALILYNTDNIPKTPVHIAKEKDTLISKQIYNILIEYDKHSSEDKNSKKLQIQLKKSCSLTQQNSCATPAEITYPKRAGTSGVSGQFYETKLLSLVLHRALHDKVIEECYLAANIRDIGDLDDVCFRFKMQEDGKTKHVLCFTQAKHREDVDKAKLTVTSVRSTSGQFCLVKYFDSFLKIRQKFLTKSKTYDPMFEAAYRSALTLDWLAAEDLRQRELAAAFETEPSPAPRSLSIDCISYARPASGKVARLMLELLKNLEGDEGTIVTDLIQALVRTKLLVETSMLDAEPDLESLVKTPNVMMGEPHTTFPRILAMTWMTVTDPVTTKKFGWCPVNRVNKYLSISKPISIAKQMKALEPVIARARFIMEEFIQHVTPLNMYQKKLPDNAATTRTLPTTLKRMVGMVETSSDITIRVRSNKRTRTPNTVRAIHVALAQSATAAPLLEADPLPSFREEAPPKATAAASCAGLFVLWPLCLFCTQ
ncbi:uncharacterized protein LOC126054708 isoform X1 [Helicoverpa armigera]|uniref:uncharacterized protein LOC126054708 isoform X1 n=1 Tax=Helicoverpa armigera TaxID=29058 RepID=UPI003082A8C3